MPSSMFKPELIPWLYERLRATGHYDVGQLRRFESMAPALANKLACSFFRELPMIEQNDIRRAYLLRDLKRELADQK